MRPLKLFGDSYILASKNHLLGALGPRGSSFLQAWLASHRRLRSVVIGNGYLILSLAFDPEGRTKVDRSVADDDAIYQLTYGKANPNPPFREPMDDPGP